MVYRSTKKPSLGLDSSLSGEGQGLEDGFSMGSIHSASESVNATKNTSSSLSMPGDASSAETTTVESDFSGKENSEDYG